MFNQNRCWQIKAWADRVSQLQVHGKQAPLVARLQTYKHRLLAAFRDLASKLPYMLGDRLSQFPDRCYFFFFFAELRECLDHYSLYHVQICPVHTVNMPSQRDGGRVLLLQCEILSELLREDHACSLKLNLAGVRGISNQRLPP